MHHCVPEVEQALAENAGRREKGRDSRSQSGERHATGVLVEYSVSCTGEVPELAERA
jgi:hypothetical protein